MTVAQLRLAKTGQAPAWIFWSAEGERKRCVAGGEVEGKGEVGKVGDDEQVVCWRGWMESLARASITRAKT